MTRVKCTTRATKARLVACLTGLAALVVAVTPGVASAHRTHHRQVVNATFTKWVVSEPTHLPSLAGIDMVGVVGGDVGDGTYAGTVISDDTLSAPGFWLAHARYEFHGSKHMFVVDFHITEDDRDSTHVTAVLKGVIVEGWLQGSRVKGEYTQLDPCPIATPGNVFGNVCFQGTVQVLRGHRHRH